MSKINLQITIEQISSGMYSYDDMVKITAAIVEGFEYQYPEYDSPASDFINSLNSAIRQWRLETP